MKDAPSLIRSRPETPSIPEKAPSRYLLATFGCQMNEYDSNMVGAMLEKRGMSITENPDEADLFVVNTCSIRGGAEDKAYARIATLRHHKRHRPDVREHDAARGVDVLAEGNQTALVPVHHRDAHVRERLLAIETLQLARHRGRAVRDSRRRRRDAAVERAYAGKKKVHWMEVLAGEKAFNKTGEWMPAESLEAVREFKVAIKGPLTTPVGGGIRSLNVALRQELDLYACIRPVRYFEGVGAPVKDPGKVDMVIFRENIEDVYSGIEFKAGTPEAEKLREFIEKEFKKKIRPQSAIGIKPMSAFGSKRLIEMAIRYALKHQKPSVTMMHKGNIMKFTEGGFRDWGYELAKEKFAGQVVAEADLEAAGKASRADAVVLKDRIADSMFQQILLRPDEYSVVATPNLNGDYLSEETTETQAPAPARTRRRRGPRRDGGGEGGPFP